MKPRMLSGALLGVSLFTGVLVAQQVPATGQYIAYPVGNDSCAGWREEREHPRTTLTGAAQQGWVLGFVSGVNFAGVSTLRATDSDGLLAFVDSYCAEHPRGDVRQATVALVQQLARKDASPAPKVDATGNARLPRRSTEPERP